MESGGRKERGEGGKGHSVNGREELTRTHDTTAHWERPIWNRYRYGPG